MAPIILPSAMSGMPPSSGGAPRSASVRIPRRLETLIRKGKSPARRVLKARILLKVKAALYLAAFRLGTPMGVTR